MTDSEKKLVLIKASVDEDIRHKFKLKCLQNKTNMNSVLIELIKKYIEED